MTKPRTYVDTSVFGGCLDDEFAQWSLALMDEFKGGRMICVISDITEKELELAPDEVRAILRDLPTGSVERVRLTEDARELVAAYLQSDVLHTKFLNDAAHVAVATLSHVSAMVSWNFKHLVNLAKVRRFNAVNLRLGHGMIEIRTPREVLPPEE